MPSVTSPSARLFALVCAATLALAGCSSDVGRTTPSANIAENSTASPVTVSPTVPASNTPTASPAVAGIPTAAPQPAPTQLGATLNASVVITLATTDPQTGGLLVGGYVNGVAEDGGDCQFVVTSAAGGSLTFNQDGAENNGTTSCGSTVFDPARAPAGSYSVVLRYSDDKGEVVSDAVKVVLP